MPKSKNYRTYPESFQDLVREACTRRIEIPCEDAKQMQSLRGHIYGFFAALKKAVADKDCPEEVRELRHMSEKVKLEFGDGNKLVALPRDESAVSLQVSAAIAAAGVSQSNRDTPKPSPELAAMVEKMTKFQPGSN